MTDKRIVNITAKARLTVELLVDVGLNQRYGPVTLAAISTRQGISMALLGQLFRKFRRSDLVVLKRGPGGGYSLSRTAVQISLAEIVLAGAGAMWVLPPRPVRANGPITCSDLWTSLNNYVFELLREVPLQQLVDEQAPLVAGGQVDCDNDEYTASHNYLKKFADARHDAAQRAFALPRTALTDFFVMDSARSKS
jgi:Rrf2 family iron-sulfur cluster assembly transcriptional regulator